jgi:hypothetical protein
MVPQNMAMTRELENSQPASLVLAIIAKAIPQPVSPHSQLVGAAFIFTIFIL